MTFPAGTAMPGGQGQQGGQAPSQGGWQQMPVPGGPVQQPNFNDPTFRGQGQQQQQYAPQSMPQAPQQYSSGQIEMARPVFPQQQQQQAPVQQQQSGGTVQVDPWGRPVQQAPQAPQQGWPQQQQQGQMAQQIPNQAQQPNHGLAPQQGGGVQFDGQGRMFGPGVPQELQGRTLQEGLQSYGMMRQMALGIAQRPGQQPAPQQQVPQQQVATPAQQVGAQAQAKTFWADPEGAIERIVEQRLAPVTQASQLQQVQTARDVVAQQFPQFLQYESQVIDKLQGMRPEVLANPEAWRLAFQQVVGESVLQGGGRFPGQQQQTQGQQQQGWQPYQNNGPRLGDFFTESPAAGFTGNGTPGDGTFGLNPAQQEMARRFNLSNQQYAQGMGIGL